MSVNSQRLGLVYVMNSWLALNFVRGQLEYFQDHGFDVTVLCPKRRDEEWEVPSPDGVRICEVPMERPIAPWRDLVTLWRLWSKMRELRPVVTNVGTPKAGLLGGLAAWLNGVPCRFYTLHGLRFETTTGLTRRLLIYAERLACRLAHRVICVSPSTREKAIASGLVTRERTVVTGCGSCNGIDVSRFAANPELTARAAKLRQQLDIPEHGTVVLFVGRLTRDKGIPELLEAFLRLEERFPELWLVLVGCFEDGDALPCDTKQNLEAHPRVMFVGAVPDTSAYYTTADIVVLPSHREGLPTVILEAQAAGKPVVGARATGILDVVAHEKTGLLFPVGDVPALAEVVARLITDKALAYRLGFAGQEQVRRNFQQERVWEALYREYFRVLHASSLASSRGPHIRKSKGLMARHNE
jgi:glycosyltransferase involved in cell wall biosynthesis